jgi:TrmH family RNA methyltransferase
MMLEITSVQNPRVKRLLALQQKSKMRKDHALFVVEGVREVERALACGYQADEIWAVSWDGLPQKMLASPAQRISCSASVFNKIAYREGHAGVLAVCKTKQHLLKNYDVPNNPLFIVIEHVEKPGNLGAILRTCNGLGVSAIFICDPKVDLYNPNVIRNSLGGFFDTPIFITSTIEAIDFLEKHHIQIAAAYLPASQPYTSVNFKGPSALVFGAEDKGLSDEWVAHANINCRVPMQGIVDSFNVSVAVAIMVGEAVRQRI